jgi:SEC-C motif-containing protein
MPCPCGSKQLFHKCCKPYHEGALPETAEKLMRSRFSAYAVGNADYIIDTTHPANPGYTTERQTWKEDIARFCTLTQFISLEVLATADGTTPDEAFVEFRATLTQLGKDASFTERSKFLRIDGKWLYVAGVIDEPT